MRHHLGQYLSWYFSARMPFVARALYGRELRAWTLFSFGLGAVEGGVVGVIAKNVFAGAVGDVALLLGVIVAMIAVGDIDLRIIGAEAAALDAASAIRQETS